MEHITGVDDLKLVELLVHFADGLVYHTVLQVAERDYALPRLRSLSQEISALVDRRSDFSPVISTVKKHVPKHVILRTVLLRSTFG